MIHLLLDQAPSFVLSGIAYLIVYLTVDLSLVIIYIYIFFIIANYYFHYVLNKPKRAERSKITPGKDIIEFRDLSLRKVKVS